MSLIQYLYFLLREKVVKKAIAAIMFLTTYYFLKVLVILKVKLLNRAPLVTKKHHLDKSIRRNHRIYCGLVCSIFASSTTYLLPLEVSVHVRIVCTKEGQKDHGLSAAFTIFCVHSIDRGAAQLAE